MLLIKLSPKSSLLIYLISYLTNKNTKELHPLDIKEKYRADLIKLMAKSSENFELIKKNPGCGHIFSEVRRVGQLPNGTK